MCCGLRYVFDFGVNLNTQLGGVEWDALVSVRIAGYLELICV